MAVRYHTSLPLLASEDATPDAGAILSRTERQLGFVPNMYRAMAQAPGLLETYTEGYTRFRTSSGLSAIEQEVVFLVISRANGCHYCVAAHSVIADRMSHVPVEITNAIRDGQSISDARLAVLASFTKHMLDRRGWPSTEAVDGFVAAGFNDRHILAIVLAIAVKTISNYTNHLFHTPIDDMFAPRSWDGSTATVV